MYGREELEYHIISDEDLYEEKVYLKNQADKVMDAMEAHIKELEGENERLKGELDREEKLMDCWGIEGLATITENNQALRAENAKLRCLALHLFNKYFF